MADDAEDAAPVRGELQLDLTAAGTAVVGKASFSMLVVPFGSITAM